MNMAWRLRLVPEKTNINFFEFENEKPIHTRKGGNYKKNVYIGYLTE